MQSIIPELTPAQRTAIRRAALNSEYHLLLGAGSSRDSIAQNGRPLPGSQELIEELCSAFKVPHEDGDLLWRIYERAKTNAGESELYSWLRGRFWGVTHPFWMEGYARSPWATVWTLNLDDTFESAHRRIATETSRKVATLNWDDTFSQDRNLNVVHLHGVVDTEDLRPLVFSLSEYAGSAAARKAWPIIFRDSYGNSPFVILGARLIDEPDIEAVISGRQPSHSAPSFYVSKEISEAMRMDLTAWGLIPVQTTAQQFLTEWSKLIGLNLDQELSSDLELGFRISQQFTELKKDPGQPEKRHDFLGGDEPTWYDIKHHNAAELGWVTAALAECKQIGSSLNESIILVHCGRRLTGRSTGLLQIGEWLQNNSWRLFQFRNDGRIDIEPILQYAASGKSLALLFDGIQDIADDVNQLVSKARSSGQRIVCVAVDQASHEASIIGRIEKTNLAYQRVGRINGTLTKSDAARIVDNLNKHGRLGILQEVSDSHRLKHFAKKELFDSMAQIENAPGFGTRLTELFEGLDSRFELRAILLVAYASYVDRKLLVVDASRMLGVNSDNLVRQIEDGSSRLSSFLKTDGKDVRPRQRYLALKSIVQILGSDEAAQTLSDAIRNISPKLNEQAQRDRHPTMVLIGEFMKYRNLAKAFPGADFDHWYTNLIDIFGDWSARYWEQRAILARDSSDSDFTLLAKAESYALRATDLLPDAYTFTTLGTVLLQKAACPAFNMQEYYRRGTDAFEQAVRRDRSNSSLVTWLAFLDYSLKVIRRIHSEESLSDTDHSDGALSIVCSDWSRIYNSLRLLGDVSEEVSRRLESLRRRFDSATTTSTSES